ncbi:hypothetical protein Sfum_0337 [Syntrophobacter fumaroxidans MPOB]|uniref:Uncharacterized protein n=1 Tax=Syntrophobacter fumaroxidans (strain DSM 10017 / MPOB) TaxID=335543 RepID=A0LF35_SYNFM|nr:hypothetical protein Sfum_0337 [Syntrophobacter fumaroxidans MPOB]
MEILPGYGSAVAGGRASLARARPGITTRKRATLRWIAPHPFPVCGFASIRTGTVASRGFTTKREKPLPRSRAGASPGRHSGLPVLAGMTAAFSHKPGVKKTKWEGGRTDRIALPMFLPPSVSRDSRAGECSKFDQ